MNWINRNHQLKKLSSALALVATLVLLVSGIAFATASTPDKWQWCNSR